jgi:MFS family permease
VPLRRLTILVSAIVLVDTAFYAVVAPLLGHYADELDLTKASAGVLVAAYPLGTLLASLPCGAMAARLGPRPTALFGLALMGGSSLVFGFAHHIVLLDAARFVQGVGGACTWAGGLAWLIAEAPAERRGELIGTALGAGIAGALFGPVAGAVAEATTPALVFCTVAALDVVLAVWALRTPVLHAPEGESLEILPDALRDPATRLGMWLVALPALSFGALAVLVPLRLDHAGWGAVAVGATFLVAAAIEACESPLVGRLSDRRGRDVPIRAGLAAAALLLVVPALAHAGPAIAVAMVAVTASLGMFWAPAMAMLSDAAEHIGASQGLAFAFVNLAWGAGQVTGSAAGGALAKATADTLVLALCAAACAVTLAALARRAAARGVGATVA